MLKLLAVGDIFLKTYNNKPPFERIDQILGTKDILFGNLETTLSDTGKTQEKFVVISSSPQQAKYLVKSGFDVLNIANNHIMDLGDEGFHNTLKALRDSNLRYIGADDKPVFNPVIIEKGGITLGFIGCMKGGFSLPEKNIWIYDLNEDTVIKEIKLLRKQCDFVIVSLHWGIENVNYPSPEQIITAHKLIDAGASVILGHHTHVIQGLEKYKEGLIAYSLGNFQFRTVYHPEINSSIILSLDFSKERLEKWDIIPVIIDPDCAPFPADESAKVEMISFMKTISDPISEGFISESWWYQEIAGKYLQGNFQAFKVRIKRYGVRHLVECLFWVISPFCLKCYLGLLRRKIRINRN
jgi:hypothetical protein